MTDIVEDKLASAASASLLPRDRSSKRSLYSGQSAMSGVQSNRNSEFRLHHCRRLRLELNHPFKLELISVVVGTPIRTARLVRSQFHSGHLSMRISHRRIEGRGLLLTLSAGFLFRINRLPAVVPLQFGGSGDRDSRKVLHLFKFGTLEFQVWMSRRIPISTTWDDYE